MGFPVVADRRHDVDTSVTARDLFHGRVARPGIAPTTIVIHADALLVTPKDLRPLGCCPFHYGRIRLLQPTPHLLGVLLAGLARGALGRVSPTAQVGAHGADGQRDSALLLDQRGHGTTGPQRAGDAKFLGLAAVQDLLEVGCLVVAEEAPRAERSAMASLRQGLQTALVVSGPPTADGFARNAKEVGNVGFGEAPFACP